MWQRVSASDDVPRGRPVRGEIAGEEAVLWRDSSGAPCAVERRCPHLDWDLSDGSVVGDELVCLGHGWSVLGSGRVFKRNEHGREDDKGATRCWTLRERDGTVEACVE